MPLPDGIPLQMISVRDIGRTAAALLLDEASLHRSGRDRRRRADRLADRRPHRRSSRTAHYLYGEVPLDVLGEDEDRKKMFQWFTRRAGVSNADFEADQAIGSRRPRFRNLVTAQLLTRDSAHRRFAHGASRHRPIAVRSGNGSPIMAPHAMTSSAAQIVAHTACRPFRRSTISSTPPIDQCASLQRVSIGQRVGSPQRQHKRLVQDGHTPADSSQSRRRR